MIEAHASPVRRARGTQISRLSECPRQRALAMTVPMAGQRRSVVVVSLRLVTSVARARQGVVQLLFQHRLDKAANPSANAVLSRRTNHRKAKSRRRQPPPSWYPSSWRGLLSSAPTPESGWLSNPETTPTNFQPLPRRDLPCRVHAQDRPLQESRWYRPPKLRHACDASIALRTFRPCCENRQASWQVCGVGKSAT